MAKTEQSAGPSVAGMIKLPDSYAVDGVSIGPVYIQDSAIVSIVKKNVLEIDGVSRLAGSNFLDSIGELVGSRKILDRSIAVQHKANGPVSINISIVAYFGVRIPALVKEINEKVSAAITGMLGISVKPVTVDVRDLEERPDDNDNKNDATDEQ